MVSTTNVKENGEETFASKLPPGKYKVVSYDIDTTGTNVTHEICHIAAYTPSAQFSQYVMPFGNLSNKSEYRHRLKVITVGMYRMLKSVKTEKILKTRSEISALTDFIQWLENLKAEGIILLTHDRKKTIPPFIIEGIRKYKLYDRFTAVVKGFANCFEIAEKKCRQTVKSHSLYSLTQVLLNKKEDLHSAADRARLSYQILQHLCTGEDDKGSGDAPSSPETDNPAMTEAVIQNATTVEEQEKKLDELKQIMERQNSLRPIFEPLRNNRLMNQRGRNSYLKRFLVQANITYENLDEAWKKDKKEGLVNLIKERITTAQPNDTEALLDILLRHFDPESYPKNQNQMRRKNDKSVEKSEEAGEDSKYKPLGEKENNDSSEKLSPGKVQSPESSPVKIEDGKTDADTSR